MAFLENPEQYSFKRTKEISLNAQGKYLVLYEPRKAARETVSVRDLRYFNSLPGQAPDFKTFLLDYFDYLRIKDSLPPLKQLAAETGMFNLAHRGIVNPDHLSPESRPDRWHNIAFALDQEYFQLTYSIFIIRNFARQYQFRHHSLIIRRVKEFVDGTTARIIDNDKDLIEIVVHELRSWDLQNQEGVGQRWRALINTPPFPGTLIVAAIDGLNEMLAQYREQKNPLPLWFAEPKF